MPRARWTASWMPSRCPARSTPRLWAGAPPRWPDWPGLRWTRSHSCARLSCWLRIQIVLNSGLRLARLLFRRGVRPSVEVDYGLSDRDAEVVIAAGCLFHCVGMAIHREDHERFSLFLTADRLGGLLADAYEE